MAQYTPPIHHLQVAVGQLRSFESGGTYLDLVLKAVLSAFFIPLIHIYAKLPQFLSKLVTLLHWYRTIPCSMEDECWWIIRFRLSIKQMIRRE
jgi:hypothetical protein